MQDHGHEHRQRLIHRQANLPGAQRKRDYQRYIEEGMSEHLAANLSQYHPVEEWDTWWGRLTVAIGWMTVVGMLLILANSAYAVVDARWQSAGRLDGEAAMIDCLNGKSVEFSDGTRWMCFRLEDRR